MVFNLIGLIMLNLEFNPLENYNTNFFSSEIDKVSPVYYLEKFQACLDKIEFLKEEQLNNLQPTLRIIKPLQVLNINMN
jgi:hypothetical protein